MTARNVGIRVSSAALLLALAACGGGGSSGSTPTPTPMVAPAARMGELQRVQGEDEIRRLKESLEERDRQLKDQAGSIAEMEKSLAELQALLPSLLPSLATPAMAAPLTPDRGTYESAAVVVPIRPAPAPVATPERHPHIDEALESMRAAKHHLETADHDFDGHRVKAIEHLNMAIHEAEICLSMK